MISFLAALQFLTIAPPLVRRAFTPAELGRAVGVFPLVGLLLGGVLAGLDALLPLPKTVNSALVLTAWVVATGALHLDGFLDSCDGLLGGHTPEERLRIMRDERVGAFAVIGGVLLLLLKYVSVLEVPSAQRGVALIVAVTLGRWSMALAVVLFPYARPEGLGRDLKDQAGWREAALATGLAGIAVGLASWPGLAAMLVAGALTWMGGRFVLGRLPGLTGDSYGALCEVVEVAVLLTCVSAGRMP